MTLQQLRYLLAISQNGLNVTAAAQKLNTSQPAVSRQIKVLERELGFSIFTRNGRALTEVTSAGEQVLARAMRIVREAQNIRRFSEEMCQRGRDELSIGTTHTQARYVLPPVIRQFLVKHPQVQLHLHQGTPEQIAEMVRLDRLDLAIATGSRQLFQRLLLLPCYRWDWRIITPRSHPLAGTTALSLEQLAAWPIIGYAFSFEGPAALQQRFVSSGLHAKVALRAHDADVIKTYVRLRLGIGVIASVDYCSQEDEDLAVMDASHLFPWQETWIGVPRGTYLRRHVQEFIQLLAPHLDRSTVDRAAELNTAGEVEALFTDVALPCR